MILFILQVLLVVVVLFLAHYLIFVWDPNYFKRLGVPGPFPYPLVGNTREIMKKGMLEFDLSLQTFGKVVGFFEGTKPILLIRDPDILQQIMVKNFNSFVNRRVLKTYDTFVDLQLTGLADDHWRHVRHLAVPAFSAGKLKAMAARINGCAKLLVANIERNIQNQSTINLKEYCGAFTMDVIAKTAFGIDVDSQQNKDNPFVHHAHKTMNQSFFRPAIVIGFFFPALSFLIKLLDLAVFPPDSREFFRDIIKRILNSRIDAGSNNQSMDMLHLIMNGHKERKQLTGPDDIKPEEDVQYKLTSGTWSSDKGLTKQELEAMSVMLLLAGYDTTASTISFFLYCMALNPACQERLYAEVSSLPADKDLTYETVHGLEYLDMCLNETLRMYPPGLRIDRVASENVTVSGLSITKGQIVGIAIYPLHHDPLIWPDPEKYDPERFTKEARQSHHPCQFIPFGAGPRICIGMRLAQLEAKIALVSVIRNFRLSKCDQTEIPITFNNGGLLQPKRDIVVHVEKRA